MMISAKGRYALRLAADMAAHQTAGSLPQKDAAQRQEIPET